nr:immunoglobulin light chain junction region [Macaca mulatta]MOW64801.1 immunoglobulin light chain junction region [Macaca mulatta]
CLQHSNYPWTF